MAAHFRIDASTVWKFVVKNAPVSWNWNRDIVLRVICLPEKVKRCYKILPAVVFNCEIGSRAFFLQCICHAIPRNRALTDGKVAVFRAVVVVNMDMTDS